MQFLDDIWASIKGNATTRIKDPVIGTFILSWCLCNWDKLATLLFGSSPVDSRIKYLADCLSISQEPMVLWDDKGLLIFPLLITLFYLFALPWLSYFVKSKLKTVTELQHDQTINTELKKQKAQLELNKAKLKANPEKDFLIDALKIDLQEQQAKAESEKAEAEIKKAQAEKDKTEAAEKKAIREQNQIELDRKKIQAEREKQKFDEQSVIHEATIACHRFPAAWHFITLLSDSLVSDGVFITTKASSQCISALFGYSTFEELLNDKNFNNENLNDLKYIVYDKELAKSIEQIVMDEQSMNEDLTEDLIFDHLYHLFDGGTCELISAENLAERLAEDIDINSHELLQAEELSGPMADTDTQFDEIHLSPSKASLIHPLGFEIEMRGYASGKHRNDRNIKGQELKVFVRAICKPVLGKFGLKDYEFDEISGSPRHFE